MTTVIDLFNQALASNFGILVAFDYNQDGYKLRRKLYAEREKQRRENIAAYDSLSFVMKYDRGELWIVRRDVIYKRSALPDYTISPLGESDLPFYIGTRGKSKPSLISLAMIEAIKRRIP